MSTENINAEQSEMSDKQESAEYLTPATTDSQSMYSMSDAASIGQKKLALPRSRRRLLQKANNKLIKIGLGCHALKQKRRLPHNKASSPLYTSLMKKQCPMKKGALQSPEMNLKDIEDDDDPSAYDLPNETVDLSCSGDPQANSNKTMLNNWRCLRDDIKNLSLEYESLKLSTINAKNQLHVYNSLIRTEKRHTEELMAEINRTAAETLNVQKSAEALRSEIAEVQASKATNMTRLETKNGVVQTLKEMLEESKGNLKKFQESDKDLVCQLNVELAKKKALTESIEHLQNEKAKMLLEISKLEEEEKAVLNSQKIKSKIALEELTELQLQLENQTKMVAEQADALQELQEEVIAWRKKAQALRTQLVTTLGNRIYYYIYKMLGYKKTMTIVHCVAAHLLPGVPPPKVTAAKLPITVTWEQALKLMKR